MKNLSERLVNIKTKFKEKRNTISVFLKITIGILIDIKIVTFFNETRGNYVFYQ